MSCIKTFALILLLFCFKVGAEQSKWATSQTTFDQSPLTTGVDLQFVPSRYSHYAWTPQGATFDGAGQGFHLGVEWFPLDQRYGKLGVGGGSGFSMLRDVGVNGVYASLGVIPIETYVSYRFDYIPYQLFVPFVKAGIDVSLVGQRGGVPVPGIQTYWGFDYGAGLELSLTSIDRRTSRLMDRSMGVNNVYLIVEYLRSSFLAKARQPDLTREELRLGLRFEI